MRSPDLPNILELRVVSHHRRELGRNRTRVFGAGGGTIGRAPDNFWVLPDPQNFISAHHCFIECRDGGFWVTDTSRNGVFINRSSDPVGQGVQVELTHGDRLRLADYEMLVRIKRDQGSFAVRVGEESVDPSGETRFVATNPRITIPPSSRSEGAVERDARGARSDHRVEEESAAGRPERRLRIVSPAADVLGGEPARARYFKPGVVNPEVMERHLIVPALQDQDAVRAYKLLRTRVLRRMTANAWHSIAVTGTTEGEGKTVTAINLAVAIAWQSRTPVVLLDLDLQRPRVAEYLGLSIDRGLTDYLVKEAEIADIIYSLDISKMAPNVEHISVIPSLLPQRQSSELLVSPRMQELVTYLEEMRPRPIIVYDMSPVLLCDDVLAFAPNFDTTLLVVSAGVTQRSALARAEELLSEVNMLGAVLNRSPERTDRGYYY
jgi:Mrp family chromosome partitioning ATPase